MNRMAVVVVSGLLAFPASSAQATAGSNCVKVPAAVVSGILAGEQAGVGGMRALASAALKSPDYASVYFVAVRFQAPGIKPVAGVWALNRLDGRGLTMSVDGYAKAFTVWLDAATTKAKIAVSDPSVRAAKKCLPRA